MISFQKKVKFLVLIVLMNVITTVVSGQHNHNEDHKHLHDNHKYHLGFGIAGTYLTVEQSVALGFHIHFLRQLGAEKKWGIGLGYESIIEENIHSSFNLLANYHPVDFLSLNAGPGLVFAKHEGKAEILPAFHTEAVFEFNLGGIHIGPMAGFGIDREESHFSLGVHLGFGF
jgi:hypothetical protein